MGPPVRLADYRPPAWLVDSVTLTIALDFDETSVHAVLAVRRNPAGPPGPLVLDGAGLVTDGVWLDGRRLDSGAHAIDERTLTIPIASAHALVETRVRIRPDANTALEGLYRSGQFLVTQCEAQGFRHITWYPDRPDVMSRYTVTLVADRERFPVLLSNGNPEAAGFAEGNTHWARWNDPHPKPCYLFALVAGRLDHIEDRYVTAEGRAVLLRIWAERDAIARCHHAMECVKRAMRWDEQRFGRCYDLDVFNIVATHDFNMGAMENKGLNIFNAKYIVADATSATDDDFLHVEGVVAHEYFHNWTGNRVTCRDWFQLSLKEGLTVFRDQEFSMDMSGNADGRAVRRIGDVRVLRSAQFPEDAGPMAHPVRPDAYQEINNFYTVTIYEKGAEVVRMAQTIFGRAGFRRGMDLYFKRHDGQAVTCEDFFAAMADANPGALSPTERAQWFRWYDQAGTPRLTANGEYDAKARTYTLRLTQSCAATPGQAHKAPFVIPVTLGLVARDGAALPLHIYGESAARGTEATLLASGTSNVFVFQNVPQAPVPSLLRGFSAPVMLDIEQGDADLALLLAHDSDAFNRWEAGQRLYLRLLTSLARTAAAGGALAVPAAVTRAFRRVLADPALDAAFKAEALALPSETYVAEQLDEVDPVAVHTARVFVRRSLARAASADLKRAVSANAVKGTYSPDPRSAGKRSLQGLALGYLAELAEPALERAAHDLYLAAGNMTDRMNALGALMLSRSELRSDALARFYATFRDDALVMDKWFALQAGARSGADGGATLDTVRSLLNHPGFSIKNPNKARALIGTFCHGNPAGFHAADAGGYDFWADRVLEIDAFNPQVAARLARAASAWRKLEPKRRAALEARLQRIAAASALSKDTREVVSKTLG
ncbi:MAG: aminopeptidase N [Burkholderiales bacterium]|nr:aminopeptidase N [Burkholderiales bacterium]